MGRAAKKRERSGTAEATGEERERGDSWQWEDRHVTYPLTLSDATVCMLKRDFVQISKSINVLVTSFHSV